MCFHHAQEGPVQFLVLGLALGLSLLSHWDAWCCTRSTEIVGCVFSSSVMLAGLGLSKVAVSYALNLKRIVKKTLENFVEVDLIRAIDTNSGVGITCAILVLLSYVWKESCVFCQFLCVPKFSQIVWCWTSDLNC